MDQAYKGTNKMVIGIVFGVLTFWLFAQSMVNVVPSVQKDLGISLGTLNIAISLSALFSGMFIVAAGGLADKIGRKKVAVFGYLLSIIGSLCLVITQGAVLLIIGRIIIGLSAACIMPATIALIKAYFAEEDRQRALSYWAIGSWGGTGIASFAGGTIATTLGWRWIFIFSIILALIGLFLLKDTPESKQSSTGKFQFDYSGLAIFIVAMVALNILITFGAEFGWISFTSVLLIAIAAIGIVCFIFVERRKKIVLIDFELFKNKSYTGTVVSNFFLNAVAGTLIVANTYVQVGRGFSSFQSGTLTLGYLIIILIMIRVGEKVLQKVGAKLPMLIGTSCATIGVAMMSLTFLPNLPYTIVVFIGFVIFGFGLGMFATPSTDTSVSNAPADKVGQAAGIFKMASSLGSAFGVAISMAVYSAMAIQGSYELAASAGIFVNVAFAVLATVAVIFLVPKDAGKTVKE